MSKIPSMSNKKLCKLLEKRGAKFVRQGKTDHAIYSRTVEGKRVFSTSSNGKESFRFYLL